MDRIRVHLKAGDGGSGTASFTREKYVRIGPPGNYITEEKSTKASAENPAAISVPEAFWDSTHEIATSWSVLVTLCYASIFH